MTEQKFRTTNRGLIIKDGKLLLIRVLDGKNEYYILPGGKQEFGETSPETVIRECQEELGCKVKVGECVLIREFIGPRRKNPVPTVANMHIKELYFLSALESEPDLKLREGEQKEIVWVSFDQLPQKDLKPEYVKNNIRALIGRGAQGALYAGDVD